jgi:hypothetical protein
MPGGDAAACVKDAAVTGFRCVKLQFFGFIDHQG